ncbi:MAG UNVERIFIED_CONTAM: aminoacyl-tRNA hydrolase [Rickettsiaceae bacterium]|jgi:PTH1 family peptidyl-tRNA hydrolase
MLIVGLGNPGSEYKATRHNAGFLAIDSIADYLSCNWQHSSKFSGDIATTIHDGKKIILFKPGNYMNLSGLPVSQVKSYYKIDNSNIFVMHDELDLEAGDLRYKFAGGSAGHNGIKSLDASIGNNYHRIRIGIGKPFDKDQVSDFVLH